MLKSPDIILTSTPTCSMCISTVDTLCICFFVIAQHSSTLLLNLLATILSHSAHLPLSEGRHDSERLNVISLNQACRVLSDPSP